MREHHITVYQKEPEGLWPSVRDWTKRASPKAAVNMSGCRDPEIHGKLTHGFC